MSILYFLLKCLAVWVFLECYALFRYAREIAALRLRVEEALIRQEHLALENEKIDLKQEALFNKMN